MWLAVDLMFKERIVCHIAFALSMRVGGELHVRLMMVKHMHRLGTVYQVNNASKQYKCALNMLKCLLV